MHDRYKCSFQGERVKVEQDTQGDAYKRGNEGGDEGKAQRGKGDKEDFFIAREYKTECLAKYSVHSLFLFFG